MTPIGKWLEALRSDRYTQEFAALKKDGAHCAIGLLFELNGCLSWDGKLLRKKGTLAATRMEALAVLQRLGVPLALAERVVEMNDVDRQPFAVIADFVEKRMAEEGA